MAMATSTLHPFTYFSTSIDTFRLSVSALVSRQCVTLPPQPQPHLIKTTTTYGGKIARNVVTMATDTEAPTEVVSSEVELSPEILKTLQEIWDKVEDKYAVISLAVAALVALWVSTGMISAIDRLPLISGVLELIGIGYTGWFVYANLIYQPQREALLEKIKGSYKEITGIN